MIIKYISNDGTEFDNEEACSSYELEKQLSFITMYDRERNPVSSPYNCRFVNLIDENSVSSFRNVLLERGLVIDGLKKPGVYMWSYDTKWLNLDEVMIDIRGGK